MKNNVVPKIFFLSLIIIVIVSIIIAIKENNKERTVLMYNNMCHKDNYTFTIIEENKDINYSLTIAKKGNYMSIDTKSNDEHTSTLVKDDIAYYIMHNEQEYYLYDSKEIDADIFTSDLKGIDQKHNTKGHEKVNGIKYSYEEYEDITAFIMWLDYNQEENKVKTRFYFDGNDIKYIKNIIDGEEELLKVDFSYQVRDEIFDIPENYAEL